MLFLALFIFWVILNACLSLEIIILGLALCSAVYILSLKLLKKSLRDDFGLLLLLPDILVYLLVLLYEITLSALFVMKVILSTNPDIDPGLVGFYAGIKDKKAGYFYATSITLTPSTYSVGLKDGVFFVHNLDKRKHHAESSALLSRIKRIEGKYYDRT